MNFIKEAFKDRTIGFYMGVAAGAIAFITAIIYLIYSLSVGLFVAWIFVFLLAGALSTAVVIFARLEFAPLIPVLFYSLAFGFYLFDRMEMFAYMATGIYGMGESGAILGVVLLILGLTFVSIGLSCFSCFRKTEKGAF